MSNYRGGRGGGYPPQEGYGQGNYRPQRQEYPPYGGQPGYPQQQAGAGGYPHQHHHQHQFQQAYVPPQRDAYAQQAYGQHAQPTYPPQQQGYDAAQFGGYPPHQNYGDRAPAGYNPHQGYQGRPNAYNNNYQTHHHHHHHQGYQGRGGYQQPYGGPRHHNQYNPSYGRGRGGSFRGQGRGGYGGRGQGRDFYALVHLPSFAELEEVGRKGSLETVVPHFMDTVARRARGNPIHLLLIVEKKYLAGCMSLPKGRDDVFLSPTTTQTFMNVEAVLSDDGDRMVQAENGSTVARHIFTQFKRYLTSLAGFDKPATDSGEVSLEELPAQESLRLMEQNKEVFRKVQEALKPDTDAATELFIKLTFAAPALDGGAEKKEVTSEDGAPADGATQRPVVRKCLLTSAQGSQLFLECMSNPKKRAAFFEHLASVIEGKVDSAFFYKTFFNSVYTSELILNSFGCSIVGAPATLNANEVKIICDGFSRFGLLVLCASGGSSVVAALVQALRPNYKAKPIGKIVSGDKRPRDTDDEEKHSGAASCPASLDAYTFPAPPSDWSFFFACAKSFVGGDMEDDETKPAEGGANEEGSESQAKAKRIELLSQHIVACRAVQIFIPHFTDSILDKEKNGSKDGDMQTFQQNCHTFLSELTQRFYSLVTHQHGNYVAQTMIAELAPRAVPNTPIFEFMREISNVLAQHAFDLSTQKCSSNCVERALECTMANPDEGVQFLFRVAKQFLSKAPHEVLGVATNMFGNYVVRHMCQSLSSVVVGNTKVTAPEVLKEAKDLEKQLFDIIEKGQATIQSVATGSGVMSWMTANKARITSS